MEPKAVTGDQLVEKLDSLDMKNSRPTSEGSFDYVEEKADTMDTPIVPTLSINTTEQWEKQLMKDPKVLYYPNQTQLHITDAGYRTDSPSQLLHNMAITSLSSVRLRSETFRDSMSSYLWRVRQ